MQWFGRAGWALICDDCEQAQTPVGMRCAHCADPIEADDDGVLMPALGLRHGSYAYHADCHIRRAVGGLNHLRGKCTCCGGTEPPDPPELGRREAARLAVEWFRRSGR